MRGYLLRLKQQGQEIWQGLTKRQKLIVSGGALLVLLSLALITTFASRPNYVPLFSNLGPQDAGEIIQRLDAMKISYKLGNGGSEILVPEKDVYATRIKLASEGLPKNGVVGLESLDNPGFGETETDKQIKYVRAIQGELTRTIEKISGVKEARVLIVPRKESLFIKDTTPATASVMLNLEPGVQLDKKQVRGIANLVASSVEGLKPENISIVDNNGNMLNNLGDLPTGNNPEGMMEYQKTFQLDLEKSLQTLLEQVLGPGNVVTKVTAELNFDQQVVDETQYTPVVNEQGIIRSIQELNEVVKSKGASNGGNAGTDSNVTQYPSPNGNQEYNSEKSNVVRNYEINEIKRHLEVAPGGIRRLSVAVVVNGNLSNEEKDAIAKTVSAAVGLNPNRGDQVTVDSRPFNQDLKNLWNEQLANEAKQRNLWMILGGVGAALLLGMVVFGLRRIKSRKQNEELLVLEQEMAKSVAQAKPKAASLTPEEEERLRLREEVAKVVKQKPESAAQLIKTWLSEE